MEKKISGDGDEESFLLILYFLFILSIELLYNIFPQYVYACGIIYYPIMSFIFNIYSLVSIYYLLVSDIWFKCDVDLSDCMKQFFKHGKRYFSLQRREYVYLAIIRLSLVALIYQPSFNPIIRSYFIYELNIHHNRSYFNNYCLDRTIYT